MVNIRIDLRGIVTSEEGNGLGEGSYRYKDMDHGWKFEGRATDKVMEERGPMGE